MEKKNENENLPNLVKDTHLQFQEAERSSNKINLRKPIPKAHNKHLKTKVKKVLKAAREK